MKTNVYLRLIVVLWAALWLSPESSLAKAPQGPSPRVVAKIKAFEVTALNSSLRTLRSVGTTSPIAVAQLADTHDRPQIAAMMTEGGIAWTDFFAGAVWRPIQITRTRATAFLFNPVYDEVLFTYWQPASDGWRLTGLRVASGASVRGDTQTATPSWVLAKDPVHALTATLPSAEAAKKVMDVPATPSALAELRSRVFLMKYGAAQLKEIPGAVDAFGGMLRTLRTGDQTLLVSLGVKPDVASGIAKLPDVFRRDFNLYGTVATSNGFLSVVGPQTTPGFLYLIGQSRDGRVTQIGTLLIEPQKANGEAS